MHEQDLEYAGFWMRVGAALVDTLLLLVVTVPLLITVYGWGYYGPFRTGIIAGPADVLINYILPAIAVILFWHYAQATPGKMAISARIVDAETGEKPSTGQFIGRYLGYFVAIIPLGLGILWVAIDRRKQGWHDKLAGTVVVRNTQPEPVSFNNPSARQDPSLD
ncbi:RDD family protein [Guyparkeria sp. GHLCS8-2]|uniref:RDD family protein n=1 Tax=Guyparkeria halopsychrophila TaxID=3139421 RepID=UPI0037C921DD